MEVSPFPHHGPLDPGELHGRHELVVDLVERVTRRQVTALLGPRRFGKTSVLRRVSSDLAAAGTSVVWLDLYEATSMVDVALRLDAALVGGRGPVAAALERSAASLGVSLGVVRVEFSKPSRPDPIATVHGLLDALVAGALSTPTLLVIDELSSLARVEGAAGLLRTKLQHHYADLGLLFAGSEPSTMRMMFEGREQPFFAQADLVEIEGLSQATVVDLVQDGFARTGRTPGFLASDIWAFAAGHPHRTMQLAHHAWQLAEPGPDLSADLWARALDLVMGHAEVSSRMLFSSLDRSEQSVLRILSGGESIYGRAAELLALNPSPARAAVARLRDAGHLTVSDPPRTVDPVLAEWLRRTLPV